jgi:Ca2+-binding EF-hand superfamily protein
MISRRTILGRAAAGLALAGVLGQAGPSFAQSGAMKMLDTDNDGTVDLAEAKKAAGALFDKLEKDHDGTLDKRELEGRLSPKELAAGDPDKDGTLTKDEYLAIVEQRFKAADADNDGTLTQKELSTRAGRALMKLLK